jgi:DEAD/DEAH box helicase domain-containing protein
MRDWSSVTYASATEPRTAVAILDRLLAAPGRRERVTHVEIVPARRGVTTDWPAWAHPRLIEQLATVGIRQPWSHQVAAAEHAWAGQSVVLSAGTSAGKSLAYLLPALTKMLAAPRTAPAPTVLYIAPTKALAADQWRAVRALDLEQDGVRAATLDGDTTIEGRDWIKSNATYVLTNPDMLHRTILPGHPRWSRLFRSLAYVVIDECHTYRGVFGSHVAQVVRRLRRIAARHGASPVFVLASATVSEPAVSASKLTGAPVVAVTEDGSPHGETAFALWEPPLTRFTGEHGAPIRRSVVAETADLLADLVTDGVRTVAFHRSRRGAEIAAILSKQALIPINRGLADRVAAYRAGYLAEERRALERALHRGELVGVAATSALELGVDVSGLDAVLLAGYPGTRSSMWQQAGRAGRGGGDALAVLVARDDPLDTFLVHHPEALFGAPVEATVLDPDNPYVLAPHLCAAACELPLTEADLSLFGPVAAVLLPDLEARGLLRRRAAGWFWTKAERASDLADIRGAGARPVEVVENATGRLLGTVDAAAAHATVHDGAVYLHQGDTYLVDHLDLGDATAFVDAATPDFTTTARDVTDIRVRSQDREESWGDARLCFGTVQVTNQVVSYLRKRVVSGEILGEVPLDLPPRHLRTRAVWWTLSEAQVEATGIAWPDLGGCLHAAEHASIGLLPLFATCDRWDIGGVSTAMHEDTGLPTVFVYDGQQGGAGFAERGYARAGEWLLATKAAIAACECAAGCPACVQSPKCGNGNVPLDKAGAIRVLDTLLDGAPSG